MVVALAATAIALLAPPSPARGAARGPVAPTVAVIGDSIAWKARDELAARLDAGRPLTLFLASNAAQIDTALPSVVDALAAPDVPPIWVVALGHAYTERGHPPRVVRSDIRALLSALSPVATCIRWLDITTRRTFYARVNAGARTFNRILREEVARVPNAEVMPYEHWARLAPVAVWAADGLHHTRAGKREMAELVRQAADGCDPATNSGPYWDVADAWPEAAAVRDLHDSAALPVRPDRTLRSRLGLVDVPASRGLVASTLWRLAGAPLGDGPVPWVDVDRTLRPALRWIDDEGLVGVGDGRYRPREVATRGHLVRLLWKRAGRPLVGGDLPWSDVPPALLAPLRWFATTPAAQVFDGAAFAADQGLTKQELVRLLSPRSGPVASAPPGGPSEVVPDVVELPEPAVAFGVEP